MEKGVILKKINLAVGSHEDCDRKDWMLRDPLRYLKVRTLAGHVW